MRQLLIAAALIAPLMAQTPYLKFPDGPKTPATLVNPLGNVRFPPAQGLLKQVEPLHPLAEQAGRALQKAKRLIKQRSEIVLKAWRSEGCAQIQLVVPAPTTDPQMIVGPPQGFQSNMPMMKAMPACETSPR